MPNDQRGGSGNFQNDPQRASEAGRKGGEHSHGSKQPDDGSSHQKNAGGSNPDKSKDAGHKGGQR